MDIKNDDHVLPISYKCLRPAARQQFPCLAVLIEKNPLDPPEEAGTATEQMHQQRSTNAGMPVLSTIKPHKSFSSPYKILIYPFSRTSQPIWPLHETLTRPYKQF